MKKYLIFGIAAMLILATGCTMPASFEKNKKSEVSFLAMDTYMKLTAYGSYDDELQNAQDYILDLEKKLSTTDKDSEVSRLNKDKKLANASKPTVELIAESIEAYEKTDKSFDFALYPISKLWGFTTGKYKVPSQNEIEELLPHVTPSNSSIQISGESISLTDEKMELDLGGIAKGYAADKVMEQLAEAGCTSAVISLGNNIQTLGLKPDGSKWNIGIMHPSDENKQLGSVLVKDAAVVTSGGYERYFEQDNHHYCHIIDPATGVPVENGLSSVTIISKSGKEADVLSTALFVMGKEKAIEFWQKGQYDFDFVMFTESGELYISEGIATEFKSELSYQIIK